MSKVRIVDKTEKVIDFVENRSDSAIEAMATDILRYSKIIAPHKDGSLVESGETEQISSRHWRVWFGRTQAGEYAAYQHRGVRLDGTRRVKKWTTPGTGPLFLKKAGSQIGRQALIYFRRALWSGK